MWPPSRGTPLAASGGRSRRARFEGQRATDDPTRGKGRTGQVTRQGCWHQLKTETASLGRADSAGGMLRDHQRRRRRTCDDAGPRRVTWDAGPQCTTWADTSLRRSVQRRCVESKVVLRAKQKGSCSGIQSLPRTCTRTSVSGRECKKTSATAQTWVGGARRNGRGRRRA